ncbi:MAG TPA: hypothetical protein DEO36_05335 [Flavobacteriaceae bacterium]|jgi:pimeloyl-ACP methyl ester carboxylesterase|nr:hypothetical protein [Flavobacteriaceae bacterium]
MPILILWGEYDFAVSKSQRNEIIMEINASNLTNIIFPESGHYMMFHQPDLFATSILDFINNL